MSEPLPDARPLPDVARALSLQRKASIVVLQITRAGEVVSCEDAASLRWNDGKVVVLTAMAIALREMLELAEASLAAARKDEPS